jgi:hypothetical protein
MSRLGLGIAAAILLACACTGSHKDEEPLEPTRADLTGAFAIALQADPDYGWNQIVKITAGGTEPVLSTSYPTWFLTDSTTHFIAVGFERVVGTNGESFYCGHVAIPKDAAGGPVKCLTPGDDFGGFDGTEYWAEPVTTRGSEVFFGLTARVGENLENLQDQIRRWDGISDTTTTIMAIGGVRWASVTNSAGNMCATQGQGTFYCGEPEVGTYEEVVVPGDGHYFRIGRYLIGDEQTLDLADQSMVATTGGGSVPYFVNFERKIVAMPDGTFVGLDDELELVHISAPNRLQRIGTNGSGHFDAFFGFASFGYGYRSASEDLRRIDLTALTVGTANFLSSLGMLSVNGIQLTTNDRLRVDGTGTNGFPAIVFLDVNTGEISSDTSEGPTINQIYSLE